MTSPSFGALLNSTPKGEFARADKVIEIEGCFAAIAQVRLWHMRLHDAGQLMTAYWSEGDLPDLRIAGFIRRNLKATRAVV